MKYGTSLGNAGSPMTGQGILSTKKRESVFSDARMSMPGGSFYTSGEGESPMPITPAKGQNLKAVPPVVGQGSHFLMKAQGCGLKDLVNECTYYKYDL
jgi:hypothetical protein